MESCRRFGLSSIIRSVALSAVAAGMSLLAIPGRAAAQGWPGYGRDQQHSCLASSGSMIPQKIRWSTPVDLAPPNTGGGDLLVHYGTPVITRLNTVLVPVKTTLAGDYRVEAHSATTGTTLWTSTSDYTLPTHDWVPIFGITLTPKDHYVVYPGAGGTIYARTFPDSAPGTTSQFAFFNPTVNGVTTDIYHSNAAVFNSNIQICTPISSDALGNLYFGYVAASFSLPPHYPNGIPSGLARVSSTGVGTFISAPAMSGDASMTKVAYNCAPAFSPDGTTVYVAVNGNSGEGYLCALATATLAPKSSVYLYDPSTVPANPQGADINDDGSATPTIGPDGDVYFGVLAHNISDNHLRGYLLHFDSTLTHTKLPSAFGWDDTASIVPASAVHSYTGPSSYLLLTKYNNYGEGGGDGINKLAVVDPNTSAFDPISGLEVMEPVITVAGVTPDGDFPTLPGAVREWCINSAAIDTVNKCAVVNSEDGHVYRWDFTSNSLSAGLDLAPATGEAYTPTVIGPDGAVYAINDAKLFCCVAATPNAAGVTVKPSRKR